MNLGEQKKDENAEDGKTFNWNSYQKSLNNIHKEVKKQGIMSTAMLSQWDLGMADTYRTEVKSDLEELNVQVQSLCKYDEKGEVFGVPIDVEINLIMIKNTMLLCEIKGRVNHADMYCFHRQSIYFQKIIKRKADRLVVISPVVTKDAQAAADYFGIKIYSYVEDMEGDISSFMQ